MEEIFKDITEYEGSYQISNHGQVKSLVFDKSRILKPGLMGSGYFGVNLYSKSFLIHKLVARAFLSNRKGKTIIHHIDGNKKNNSSINLVWCTQKWHIKGHQRINPW